MADTSRERSSTWRYLDEYAKPIMDGMGISFIRASHDLATVDLYSHKGDLLIPAFTENGKLPTFCSSEWKRRVVLRKLRELGYGPKNPVRMWLGISLDEMERMKDSDTGWVEHHYPLIFDERLRRIECETIIERFGLPVPPKSTCWMCPNMNAQTWKSIKENDPDDFDRAISLEKSVYGWDDRGGVYLHKSGKFLSEIDFDAETEREPDLFDGCDSGYCWT